MMTLSTSSRSRGSISCAYSARAAASARETGTLSGPGPTLDPIAYGVAIMELPLIRERLSGYAPARRPTAGKRLAGVSMVLRDDVGDAEVLLIERATRRGEHLGRHRGPTKSLGDPSRQLETAHSRRRNRIRWLSR